MNYKDTEAIKRIIQARAGLILDHPFFGSLALRLKLVEDESVPTVYTDGNVLGYNPAFVKALSNTELQAVICHEVLHCSNGHPWREGRREHMKWNIAADFAINPIIEEDGMKLPKDCLLDPKLAGMSAEQIYNKLPDPLVIKMSGKGCGVGETRAPQGSGSADEGDDPQDGEGEGGSATGNSEGDWKVATVQAAQAAKMRGKLPASIERLIEEIVNPKVDWKAALQNIVQQILAKDDYWWRRPNNRYMASGMYLPSLYSEKIPPIIVAVDTSGSIGAKELAEFGAEITAIAAQTKPELIYVIYCDAAINRTEEYAPGEPIEMKPVGGGGTDHNPVFKHIDKEGWEPAVLICLTDGYTSYPNEAPEYPVVWAMTTDQVAPFGTTIKIE